MKQIYFLGECMVELRSIEEGADAQGTMAQSFAGDVYNSAVYLKRSYPEIQTSMVTAIGKDTLSSQMLARFEKEHLGTRFVFRHPEKAPGMYLIETDSEGERSFTYWRNDAAARKVMDFVDDDVCWDLSAGNMFFFSGISLAVIEPEARNMFWVKVASLANTGVKLVFDPNYRPRLWSSPEEAKEQFDRAFQLSQVVLPGLEDLTQLYGIESVGEAMNFLKQFQMEEIVVKNGADSVLTWHEGVQTEHQITPVAKVVDTTSAGDAFNGVYLGARLNEKLVSRAVELASAAAATVIQHPGAIAPCAAFKLAMIEAGV